MERLSVIKIGGKVIDDFDELQKFVHDFSAIPSHKIMVHGGGKWVSDMSTRLGIRVQMTEGRRITDADTLDVVTMMLPGVANKKIIALLQKYGCDAMGLTGADGNMVLARKRPIKDNVDFGFVGDITRVNSERISDLLQLGITPVFTAMTHDGKGQLLNTNADTIASSVAVSMTRNYEVDLYYCFEKEGVLEDINDGKSRIPEITTASYQDFKNKGIIHSGMLPKVENAFNALDLGVSRVHICHYRDIGLINENNTGIGTLIIK